MRTIYRYVVAEHVLPFIFAFSVILFVLLLKLMMQLIDTLISKDVSFIVMAKLLSYHLAAMLALVVPMSVLVATLMAFGRLGSSGEITALKAAGVSMYRVVAPILLIAAALTVSMIWFNNNVLPAANHRARSLWSAITISKPMLTLKNREGQFITDLPNLTIRVNSLDYVSGRMAGITLFQQEQGSYRTTILADSGYFETYPSADRLALVLQHGEIHREQPEQDRYIRSSFAVFRQLIRVNFGVDTSLEASKNDRTMTKAEMNTEIAASRRLIAEHQRQIAAIGPDIPNRDMLIADHETLIQAQTRRINSYLVEIHKKNSIPVAAVVFVLIGSSLGMLVRRSGASIGLGMSIGFFTLYYLFLIGGETAGDRMLLPAWLAMWLPNFLFGALGIVVMIRANRS